MPTREIVAMRDAGLLAEVPVDSRSNLGKWDQWYENLDCQAMGAFRYGDTVNYRMAAAFMVGIEGFED